MKKSKSEDWVEPGREALLVEQVEGYRGRSIIPDPLSVLIAAESGKPILTPIFPINEFTETSPCPHNGPIAKGSPQVCMCCHDTGLRDHPAVKLFPGDLPRLDEAEAAAEPTRYEPSARAEPGRETRKQRRARLHAERTASDEPWISA